MIFQLTLRTWLWYPFDFENFSKEETFPHDWGCRSEPCIPVPAGKKTWIVWFDRAWYMMFISCTSSPDDNCPETMEVWEELLMSQLGRFIISIPPLRHLPGNCEDKPGNNTDIISLLWWLWPWCLTSPAPAPTPDDSGMLPRFWSLWEFRLKMTNKLWCEVLPKIIVYSWMKKKQIWCYISCFAPVQTAIFRIVSCIFTNDPQHWLGSDVIIPGVAAGSLTTVAGTLQWIILKTHLNSSNRVAFCLNSIYNFINLDMCVSFDQGY